MTDDRKPRRGQSQTDRDLDGFAARRERERRDAPAGGVPALDADDLTPPPQSMLDLCEDDAAREAFKADWYSTPQASVRHRTRLDLSSQVVALSHRVSTLERWKKWLIGALTAAVVGSGGSIITVASGLYDRGSYEGRLETRLKHTELELERVRDRLERSPYRPRYERSGSLFPAPTKEE